MICFISANEKGHKSHVYCRSFENIRYIKYIVCCSRNTLGFLESTHPFLKHSSVKILHRHLYRLSGMFPHSNALHYLVVLGKKKICIPLVNEAFSDLFCNNFSLDKGIKYSRVIFIFCLYLSVRLWLFLTPEKP